ncbi:hypothetical protein PCNPT3_00730 [Psychromonas sp. CNPT3]|uniref:hypothetical protein n=1 Tax=Psychromonas sp. CNPT3 TaxID=314282 RepID=UPI00006E708D|nr:hypothetical protein [Psychromonas sp. CNPT3]AGH80088.1 hypothetical protein PCNPT3_00730 [Psychromonas sp. CNPT3]
MPIESHYPLIEIPFEHRYQCWFCGEPQDKEITFPKEKSSCRLLTHAPLNVPSCQECSTLVKHDAFESIWAYRYALKKKLIVKHQKTLNIGARWTKEELQESQFEGSAFEGFKRSAWFMFELQQARVNFAGWPVCIIGTGIICDDAQAEFTFDGTTYADFDSAIASVVSAFYLDELLFTRVLGVLGKEKFGHAIRLCRLYPNLTTSARDAVFKEILSSLGIDDPQ